MSKKKPKVFMLNDRPVTVNFGEDYTEVSLYTYNGSIDIGINREWKPGVGDLPANKKEIADVRKLIEALEDIVAHAEGF